MVPQLPQEIGMAIADHHEQIDGTGYPRHLFSDKLSMSRQIIAATDNIIFNHLGYKQYGEHTHKMLLTALKLPFYKQLNAQISDFILHAFTS